MGHIMSPHMHVALPRNSFLSSSLSKKPPSFFTPFFPRPARLQGLACSCFLYVCLRDPHSAHSSVPFASMFSAHVPLLAWAHVVDVSGSRWSSISLFSSALTSACTYSEQKKGAFLGSWCCQQIFQALITCKVRALDKLPQSLHFKIVLEDLCSLSPVSMVRKVVECEGKEAHPSTAHGVFCGHARCDRS